MPLQNTSMLTRTVTGKSIQDRYIRLQRRFDRDDRSELLMSEIRGELCEMDEPLATMKDDRDELAEEKKSRSAERWKERDLVQ